MIMASLSSGIASIGRRFNQASLQSLRRFDRGVALITASLRTGFASSITARDARTGSGATDEAHPSPRDRSRFLVPRGGEGLHEVVWCAEV